MIELSQIHKSYQMGDVSVHALKGVSLRIEPGEFVAIMGPSGSGKSTLMHVLGLLDVPDSGSYRLLGDEIAGATEDELAEYRKRTIGFVFQQFNLLARKSALENVALPMLYTGEAADLERAADTLEEVGLGSRLHHRPTELSGGQQQRVAIARALINRPRIILADEPTGNLDSTSEKEIMDLLTGLNESGITIILVSHEPDIAKYAKRIIRMRDGVVHTDERVRAQVAAPLATGARSAARTGFAVTLGQLFTHFEQGFSALVGNKVRSALSTLGITIGVGAVIAMLALGNGARESIEAQLASLGSNLLVLKPGAKKAKGGVAADGSVAIRFNLDDVEEIRTASRSIKTASPSITGRAQVAYGNANWSTQVLGTSPDYATMRASAPVLGRFFTEEENRSRARVALIGMTPYRELFGDTNPVGQIIRVNRLAFQVIGVLPEKGASGFKDQDDQIIIPVLTAMHRLLGKTYVDSVDVQIASPEEMPAAEQAIRSAIYRRHHVIASSVGKEPFQIRNMADLQEALSSTNQTLSWLLASIAAISLLVGGIGIMNIMLISVTERTREIGLRKAIGARRFDILAQFLLEAIAVSLTGGILGVLLGWSVTEILAQTLGWAARVSWESVVLSTVFAASIGVGFGIWPARRASRLSPIEALRHD